MKKILLTLLLLTGLRASAFDWTYSTNLFWTITAPTNIFCGTNSTDPARDSYIVIWNKLNADMNLMWQRIQSNTNGGGGTNSVSIAFTNTVTLPSGSSAYVTNLGYLAGVWTFQAGIPAGPAGTNTVTNTITAYNFTNQVLQSQQFVTYSTNYAIWGASNYLARVHGLYKWTLGLGNDGGNPPQSISGALLASFSGTNAWFPLTNGFQTTNWITVVETNAPGVVQGGGVSLLNVDHWELLGRNNPMFGQTWSFSDPVNSTDPATKNYVDNSIGAALNAAWVMSGGSNSVTHYAYSFYGSQILDLVGQLKYIRIDGCALDGTGTNVVIQINTTNLLTGWALQSSTNLALGGIGFVNWTNYTAVTNSGELTMTMPANLPQQFFRAVKNNGTAIALGSTIDVSHSTNSTFGLGAGLMVYSTSNGTNWLNISTAVNKWGRLAIPTNSW